ncbi:Hsp20/alpha crystallin family protein [Peribacillus alkalitolerans]|uniref:Hsp20/alpha crystallin family protein n=1 Tax=Peribacillus alkalitolerans TaxID=1550385 RepID=UPI0013D6A9D9|nr:Hsp20/alpha crystallin family protein [Peribacillus alkalitolerans]
MTNENQNDSNHQEWESLQKKAEQVLGDHFWTDFQKIMPKKYPTIDLYETPEHGFIHIEIPGIHNPQDVNIHFTGQTLNIDGQVPFPYGVPQEKLLLSERHIGPFKRSLVIPFSFYPKPINATYENGILTIALKKKNNSHTVSFTIGPKP